MLSLIYFYIFSPPSPLILFCLIISDSFFISNFFVGTGVAYSYYFLSNSFPILADATSDLDMGLLLAGSLSVFKALSYLACITFLGFLETDARLSLFSAGGTYSILLSSCLIGIYFIVGIIL